MGKKEIRRLRFLLLPESSHYHQYTLQSQIFNVLNQLLERDQFHLRKKGSRNDPLEIHQSLDRKKPLEIMFNRNVYLTCKE